jgi:hypothetical protein
VLRNNLIHDVNALVYGGWGICFNQASAGSCGGEDGDLQ